MKFIVSLWIYSSPSTDSLNKIDLHLYYNVNQMLLIKFILYYKTWIEMFLLKFLSSFSFFLNESQDFLIVCVNVRLLKFMFRVPLGHWRCDNVIPCLYFIITCTHILKLNTRNMWELKLWMVTYTQLNMYVLNIQKNFNHSWTADFILCRFILSLFYCSLNEMKTKILTQRKCNHVTWIFYL